MKNNLFHLLSLFLLITLFSCGNGSSDNYLVIETGSDYDFHTIEIHDGIVYASGGDVWNKSNIVQSSDGLEWSVDSLSNKSIFDLHSDGINLYGVGVDGYIFKGNPELQLTRTKYWGMLRGVSNSENGLVAIGGKDFNKGWIYKLNEELKVDTAFIFENEIADVICDQLGNCIASGFGIILTSDDDGYTWNRSLETGDFFNSMDYNSAGIPYAVGYSGSLMNSADNGTTWKKMKDGHSPIFSNTPFRNIKFYGSQGFIVGDNGTIWNSEDDGSSWNSISIDTEDDLIDFVLIGTKLIIVSEKGRVYLVDL